jgi:hypothetical protein
MRLRVSSTFSVGIKYPVKNARDVCNRKVLTTFSRLIRFRSVSVCFCMWYKSPLGAEFGALGKFLIPCPLQKVINKMRLRFVKSRNHLSIALALFDDQGIRIRPRFPIDGPVVESTASARNLLR